MSKLEYEPKPPRKPGEDTKKAVGIALQIIAYGSIAIVILFVAWVILFVICWYLAGDA